MTPSLKLVTRAANDPAYETKRAGTERMLLLKLSEHRQAMLSVARLEVELADLGATFIRQRYPDQREFLRPTIARIRREVGA